MCAMRRVATYRHWLGCCRVGGRGVSPFTVVKYDVRHGAGAVSDVVYFHEDPAGPDLDGGLLHVGDPGDPQVQVKGRCTVRVRGGALGVCFRLCIVQALLSPRWGHWTTYALHRCTNGAGSCWCQDPMGRCVLCVWALTGHLL